MPQPVMLKKLKLKGSMETYKTFWESYPRQVDKKSRGPQGERGLEFSRRKKGQTFFSPLHSFSSVESLSRVWLFATPWIAARQASLSITISRSSLRLTSIESVMPSSHLILSHPLLLLPPIFPSIRVFSNESTLRMRWPKYWSFSFSISPSEKTPRTDLL